MRKGVTFTLNLKKEQNSFRFKPKNSFLRGSILETKSCKLKNDGKKRRKPTGTNQESSHPIPTQKSKSLSHDETIKQIIAASELIISDPFKNLKHIGFLLNLSKQVPLNFDTLTHPQRNQSITSIAMVSLGVVFQSCLPTYELKPERTMIQGTQLSREVLQNTRHETNLLQFYHDFIRLLFERMKFQPDVVVEIMCELLIASPNFNFSDNLLQRCLEVAAAGNLKNNTSIPKNTSPTITNKIAMQARSCLMHLIESDISLSFCVKLLRISQLMYKNQKTFTSEHILLKSGVFDCFSCIKFSEIELNINREAASRGLKDQLKLKKNLSGGFISSSIYGDISQFKKNKDDIIQFLFEEIVSIITSFNNATVTDIRFVLNGLGRLLSYVEPNFAIELIKELENLLTQTTKTLDVLVFIDALWVTLLLVNTIGRENFTTNLQWFVPCLNKALSTLISSRGVISIMMSQLGESNNRLVSLFDQSTLTPLESPKVLRAKTASTINFQKNYSFQGQLSSLIMNIPDFIRKHTDPSSDMSLKFMKVVLELIIHIPDEFLKSQWISIGMKLVEELGTYLRAPRFQSFVDTDDIEVVCWSADLLFTWEKHVSNSKCFLRNKLQSHFSKFLGEEDALLF